MTKFFRGGGTIANTISDVPSAIDKMLGNYKKIAILNFENKKPNFVPEGEWSTTDIKLNISFIPNQIFVFVGTEIQNAVLDSTKNISENTHIYINRLNDKMYLEDLKNRTIRIHYYNSGGYSGAYIYQIIAIE